MALENITVEVGGQSYSTWESVSVEAGAAKAVRRCEIIAAEPNQAISAAWVFQPGAQITVRAGGDAMLTGYVDDYCPEFDGESHIAAIYARSKAKDIVDSSAVHQSGEWLNKKFTDIAKDLLQPFGLQLTTDLSNLQPIPVWRLAPGSSVFEELEVLARQAGALLIGTADGNIKLTKADNFQMGGGYLMEGVNIKHASAKLSEKHKHDKVHARGQKSKGSGSQSLRLEFIAPDSTVQRYRPKIVIVEGDTDQQRVQQRAQWQVARDAGWCTTAEITVMGWRDGDGNLWDPEKLYYVESQKLKIAQMMALQHVHFRQNSGDGTIAELSMVDPKALGGKSAGGDSNSAWETG
jgi:prophage tail gpP-like protein